MTTTTMPSARTPSARASATSARKFILPVATVIGAGALAMAMGVPWTSANEGGAGFRLHADDNQGAELTISQMEPGDSVSRNVTIRNSGAEDSRLSFEENAAPATFANGELNLKIEHDGRTVYDGTFGAMNDVSQDVGNLPPGGSSVFTFTVSLPKDAPYANQGEAAVASYSWVNSNTGSE